MSFTDLLNNYPVTAAVIVVVVVLFLRSLRIAQEYERAVIFRLGRMVGTRGPGVFIVIPLIERAFKVDTRVITHQLETQETVTRDGVAVRLNAVVWYRARDPALTIVAVRDWNDAVRQASETSLRDTIGQNELDSLLKERAMANNTLRHILSETVSRWGVEITAVEIKDLDIPEAMQRAIAREAEAIRERRARVIKADGEFEASAKLAQAAATMADNPLAMELRRQQTMTEIGAEHNSVIILALPTGITETASAAGVSRALTAIHPGAEPN
jgi:regulator of protease activity HflC (stomatin/prohibitin superfamily)